MIVVGRPHRLRGVTTGEHVLAALAVLAAVALVWWLLRPEPRVALAECRSPELVIVAVDDSQSVRDLDPDDARARAVRSTLRMLAASPCTSHDVAAVVSFTDRRTVTGPAPIASLGAIERAPGEQTDIASAVDAAVSMTIDFPGHRVVVILVSDLEEGAAKPIDDTLAQLDRHEAFVVPIGSAVDSAFRLDDSDAIAERLVRAINSSRSAE